MSDGPARDPLLDDLDGHTIEQLVDYLDRGRTPFDAGIESSPACRIALAGLDRLQAMAGGLLDDDAATAAQDAWVADVLERISLESSAGRRFPFALDLPGVDAVVTEGALRGLLRAIGDSVPGLLAGRVRLTVLEPGGEVDIDMEANLFYGYSAQAAAAELRSRIQALLPRHAPFTVRRVDLRIRDVIVPTGGGVS